MLFLSTFQNRIDKKGRLSIPAQFRAALSQQPFAGIIAYQSLSNNCIEACGMDRISKLNSYIETLPPFSDERDALAAVVFGDSVQLAFDGEGRVLFPERLLKAANIKEEAMLVGKGEIFELWEPKAYEAHRQKARSLALSVRKQFRPQGGNA